MHKQIGYLKFLYGLGGVRRVLSHIRENVAFDLKHGTNTSSWLPENEFKNAPPNIEHGVKYRSSYTSTIQTAFDKARKVLPEAKSLFAIGCGKGKDVAIAAMSGDFDRVVGVDYYSPFLEIVADNVGKVSAMDVELVNLDASEFVDFDMASIIYMYNPFDAVIMDQVRRNIEANTQKAVVAYNKPEHVKLFTDNGWKIEHESVNDNEDTNLTILSYGL